MEEAWKQIQEHRWSKVEFIDPVLNEDPEDYLGKKAEVDNLLDNDTVKSQTQVDNVKSNLEDVEVNVESLTLSLEAL